MIILSLLSLNRLRDSRNRRKERRGSQRRDHRYYRKRKVIIRKIH